MSSIPTSSSRFQTIFDAAMSDYTKKTGIDLVTHPFAQTLQNCQSSDAILDLLQDKAKQFNTYRDVNRKLINCLKPVVQVLHTVSAVLAEATATVSHSDRSSLSDPLFYASPSRCHSNLPKQSSSASMSSLPYVSPSPFFNFSFVIFGHSDRYRNQCQLRRAR
jgi:hypothetical protein